MRIKLYAPNNVVATGLATFDLSNLLGFTVKRIVLQLGGGSLTKSMLTSIQLKANAKIVMDTTGSCVDARMSYRGITANAAFLSLDFSELRSKTENGQNIGAIDTTAGISSLKLEVAISGATTPTISGWAEVTRPQVDPAQAPTRNLIARVHRSTITIGAAGTFAIPVPHFAVADGGSIFKRIALFSSNCTGVQVKKNGIIIEDAIKALNDFEQTEFGKASQSGLYMVDFIADNNQSGVLNTRDAQTMEILGTFSGAETITVESELLEPLAAF